MNYQNIINGLESGEITILSDHVTKSLIDEIRNRLEQLKNKINKNDINQELINFYKAELYDDFEVGKYINGIYEYCSDCDSQLCTVVIDNKTIAYIKSKDYWNISKNDEYVFTLSDIKPCECSVIRAQNKLISEIKVESGKLIFDNYFKTNILYDYPENKYSHPSICSLLGRNELMQYFAKNNVGYGQMSNMSVSIYSNEKDEIIVGNSLDGYQDDKPYYIKYPNELTEEIKKDQDNALKFEKYLEAGNFKNLGYISLDVWRWQCADKNILDLHNEEVGEDSILTNVLPGTWTIEHYYDFPENGDYIYSRLKLKQ